MARRSDHSREELHEMALEAARDIVESEGLRGLSARRVARDMGYTIGTIYNLFDDFDDLILHMNGRTLDALHGTLVILHLDQEPRKALGDLAERYLQFTGGSPKLWNALFEHQLPDGRERPVWHEEKILRLLRIVEQALAPLFGPGEEEARLHTARVMWSSLHGICSLESSNNMAVTESAARMVETLLTCFMGGLQYRLQKNQLLNKKSIEQ